MKKLYIVAALLMASTAADAGNAVSFEIDGHRIRIEAPRNCDSLSCIQISAPGLSGSGFGFKNIKSNRLDDDNDVALRTDPPAQNSAPAPCSGGRAAAIRPCGRQRSTRLDRYCIDLISASRRRRCCPIG